MNFFYVQCIKNQTYWRHKRKHQQWSRYKCRRRKYDSDNNCWI